MLMRLQQLCKSSRTCFKFYCTFYFTCDRSFNDNKRVTECYLRVKRRDGVKHAMAVGEVTEIELNLGGRRVGDKCYPAVPGVHAGSVQQEVEDEVQFVLDVFRLQVVGLV